MVHSRNKGAAGERELALYLTQLGIPARRGTNLTGQADVVIPGSKIHVEVKRQKRPNIYAAMAQAIRDCNGNTPLVASRRDRDEWLFTIRAADLKRFVKEFYGRLVD